MSISKFTAALKNRTDEKFTADAKQLLDRFVQQSSAAFAGGGIRKSASTITENSTLFRKAGEKQGRTRIVLTEDDLREMFKTLNISSTSEPIALYVKFLADKFSTKMARHYEIYLRDGSVVERGRSTIAEVINTLDSNDIIAVRGLNFSHENTLIHVAHFLHSIKVFPGKSRKDIEEILVGEYDRGHVYAQTYGRANISLGELANEDNILSEILRLYQLMDEGSTSLTRIDGKYNELLARANKDFSSKRIAMNIQLQIKRDVNTGKGNRDTGDLSSYIRIVGFLQKLIQNSKLSSDGRRQLGVPAATSLKEFEKALNDLNSKFTKYNQQISKVISGTSDPDYLVRLQTSDDILTYLGKSVAATIGGTTAAPLKVSTPSISVVKTAPVKTKVSSGLKAVSTKVAKLKQQINSVKKELEKPKVAKPIKGVGVSFNILELQNLIQSQIALRIRENMGTGNSKTVLNYRTGRFAQSVKVERLSISREGMITAFYSYMKNPYATFSKGGRQENPPSRDPKLLIARSIRDIAAQKVSNRLRSVNV